LTKITKQQISKIQLNNYTHLILPSGKYQSLSDKESDKIKTWIKQGGSLISFQESAMWAEKTMQGFKKDSSEDDNIENPKDNKSYAEFETDQAKNTIGGAIISAHADLTHPLGFGMQQTTQYPLLKGNSQLTPSKNQYSSPLIATDNARAAGYISDGKLEKINNSPLIIADKIGKGVVIKFNFNPIFRGFWLGTQRWLINAVYFSSLIKKTELD